MQPFAHLVWSTQPSYFSISATQTHLILDMGCALAKETVHYLHLQQIQGDLKVKALHSKVLQRQNFKDMKNWTRLLISLCK